MALSYKSSLVRYRQYLQNNQNLALWQAGMFAIFSLALLIVLIAFALRPTLVTIAGLIGQIREQKVLYQKLSEKSLAVQQASTLLQEQQSRLGVLDEALPATARWSDWITSVENLARSASVDLQVLTIDGVQVLGSPTAPVNRPTQVVVSGPTQKPLFPVGVTSVPFLVSATGSYTQLKDFVAKLEGTRRLVVLSQSGIVKDKDGTLTGTFTGAIGYAASSNLP